MNKQELIDVLKKYQNGYQGETDGYFKGAYDAYGVALRLVEKLDEQPKVTAPQFVAKWINQCKEKDTLADCLDGYYEISNGEGGNVTVNFYSKGYEEWEQAFNQIKQTTSESLRISFIGYTAGIRAHPYKEQGDEDYMGYGEQFFEGDVWKQKRQDILDSIKPLTKEDVSFYLNRKVPKLYIKGQEVWVVSMTNHYVTSHEWGEGTNVITFIYVTNDDPKQKVLSIDRITGEVMNQ